jgi:hypothetical protein
MSEIDGVRSFLLGLASHVGLDRKFMDRCSEFFKTCRKRAEDFFVAEVHDPPKAGSAKVMGKVRYVSGAEALRHRFTVCKEQVTVAKQSVHLKELTLLRTFGWVFDPSEEADINNWIRQACIANACAVEGCGTGAAAIKDIGSGSSSTILAVCAAASSSSSSASAAAVDPALAADCAKNKKDRKKEEADIVFNDSRLKMFSGAAKKPKVF